jgi:hypothetical protein
MPLPKCHGKSGRIVFFAISADLSWLPGPKTQQTTFNQKRVGSSSGRREWCVEMVVDLGQRLGMKKRPTPTRGPSSLPLNRTAYQVSMSSVNYQMLSSASLPADNGPFAPRPFKRSCSPDTERSVTACSYAGTVDDDWVNVGSFEGGLTSVDIPSLQLESTNDVSMQAEALPGIGFSCSSMNGSTMLTVVFKRNYDADSAPLHRFVALLALDTTRSMRSNGGFAGQKTVVSRMSSYGEDLPDLGVKFSVGGYNFDERAGKISSLAPLGDFADKAAELSNALHYDGCGTNIDNAVRAGIESLKKHVCEATGRVAGVLVVSSDGDANQGIKSGKAIASRTAGEVRDLPISVHCISLGTDTNARFLHDLVSTSTGLIGFAPRCKGAY